MSLKLRGYIDLPTHEQAGGFDHAAVHRASNQLFVAHTANNTLDVIDCTSDHYLHSIPDLTGIAGALVSDEHNLVFTSNRGEDTIGIFKVGEEQKITKIKVGIRPNGLSFDPRRGLLLAANVGNPDQAGSFTVSIVDIAQKKMVSNIPVPGRTRWTIFDPAAECFYVNIADPAEIAVVESATPTRIAREMKIPAKGPHGLDFDPSTNRLFCACDAGRLLALEASTGKILFEADLSDAPDVIFFNAGRKHLYVAVGDPGVIDVFDTDSLQHSDRITTEKGAHTIGFNASHNKVYAFLPASHAASIYLDE